MIEAVIANRASTLTFDARNVEFRDTKTGKNVGVRVKTDQGKVITFWSSNADEVTEHIDGAEPHVFRVVPGTQVLEDGSLIPGDSKAKGFWD